MATTATVSVEPAVTALYGARRALLRAMLEVDRLDMGSALFSVGKSIVSLDSALEEVCS